MGTASSLGFPCFQMPVEKKGRASHVSPINIYRTHEADFLIGVGKGGIFFVLEKVKLVFLEGKG